MKRSLWFFLLVSMLLLAGCSDDKELDTVNEEKNHQLKKRRWTNKIQPTKKLIQRLGRKRNRHSLR